MDLDKELARDMKVAARWTPKTHLQRAAEDLQRLVRLEAAAYRRVQKAVVSGRMRDVVTVLGDCVCVTCGFVAAWKELQGGHFLASRRNSIILEEAGVNPQCRHCNKDLGGNPEAYMLWMRRVRGPRTIERLIHRKNNIRQKWTREQLCRRRIEYRRRAKQAKEVLGEG